MAERDNDFVNRLSWIAFILAFLVCILAIIYNRPTPAPIGALESMTRSV